MEFVRHMVSDDVQRRIVHDLRMLPARQSIQNDPLFKTDPTLQASLAQLKNGRLMPTADGIAGGMGRHAAAVSGAFERRNDARGGRGGHATRGGRQD